MGINKRKHERFDALNLLSYVSIDSDGKEWDQGMGRTLNISESGLQLETHEPVDTKNTLLISIGIEDDLVEIKGKAVYTNRGASTLLDILTEDVVFESPVVHTPQRQRKIRKRH